MHVHVLNMVETDKSLRLLQTTVAENPFTSFGGREESPISIGEALITVPENKALSGHQRNTSNPFTPSEDTSVWELEKRQFVSEMAQLREQLKSETAQRIESQVSFISVTFIFFVERHFMNNCGSTCIMHVHACADI